MPSILNAAAQRVNAATAGLTGQASIPSQEPGAPHPTSPAELVELAPTEFGGLSHIFSGSSDTPLHQVAPVNTAKTIPTGSVAGRLGGLVPDVRNAAQHTVSGASREAQAAIPLSTHVKNTVASARKRLKI